MKRRIVVELDIPEDVKLCKLDYPGEDTVYAGGPRLTFFDGNGNLTVCRSPTELELVLMQSTQSVSCFNVERFVRFLARNSVGESIFLTPNPTFNIDTMAVAEELIEQGVVTKKQLAEWSNDEADQMVKRKAR